MTYGNTYQKVSYRIKNPESLLGTLNQAVLEIPLGHYNQVTRDLEYVVGLMEARFFELGVTSLTDEPETKTRGFGVFERDKLTATVYKIVNSQNNYDAELVMDTLEKVGVYVLDDCVLTLRNFVIDEKEIPWNN